MPRLEEVKAQSSRLSIWHRLQGMPCCVASHLIFLRLHCLHALEARIRCFSGPPFLRKAVCMVVAARRVLATLLRVLVNM